MARGEPGAFGGKEINILAGLARASAPSSCSASPTCAARCRCATSTCSRCSRSPSRSGSSTTGGSSRACRSSTRRSSTCSGAASGSGSAAGRAACRGRSGPSGCSPRRRSSSAGFRIGLNVSDSNVIDVGYSGVIGAQRIASGEAPYGHFPVEVGEAVRGRRTADGEIRVPDPDERPLRVGRRARRHLRARRLRGVPSRLLRRSAGRGRATTSTPRASRRSSSTSSAMIGLALVGRRFGGRRLAATLAFAWAAYPFTQYVSSSNTNDAIQPAFLIFGFWLATLAAGPAAPSPRSRAGRSSRALLLVPLWATYPDARRAARGRSRFAAGVPRGHARRVLDPPARAEPAARGARLLATGRSASRSAATRRSRSGTGGSTTPGLPDLHVLQHVLEALLVVGRARRRLRAEAEVAAPARRAHRGAPDRLRARAHALVLPLPRPGSSRSSPSPCSRRPPSRAPASRRRAAWTPGPRAGPSRLSRRRAGARRARRGRRVRGGWAALHYGFYARQPDRRHAGLPALRRRDRRTARCPTATSRSSTRPAALPVFVAPVAARSRDGDQTRVRPRRSTCSWRSAARPLVALVALALVRDRARDRRGSSAGSRSPRSRRSRSARSCSRASTSGRPRSSPRRSRRSSPAATGSRSARSALGDRGEGLPASSCCRSSSPASGSGAAGARRCVCARRLRRRRRASVVAARSSRSARTGSGTAACARRRGPLQIETLGSGRPARRCTRSSGSASDDGLEPRLAEPGRRAAGRARGRRRRVLEAAALVAIWVWFARGPAEPRPALPRVRGGRLRVRRSSARCSRRSS